MPTVGTKLEYMYLVLLWRFTMLITLTEDRLKEIEKIMEKTGNDIVYETGIDLIEEYRKLQKSHAMLESMMAHTRAYLIRMNGDI